MNTIWDILGIPPTSDKRKIKQAYAKKSAECHPEEHPEEFDQLHKAYTAAIKTASQLPAHLPPKEDTADAETASERVKPVELIPQPMEPQGHDTPDPQVSLRTKQEQQEVPAISQLVEKGMEQELKSASGKLLESFEHLHDSFPKSVNTNQDELLKALMQLEQWAESPRFKMVGWEPDFLRQLDQWLSLNRDKINRAEAIALYKIYRFKYFKSPSYPIVPFMDNINWEVMQKAFLYEKDMVSMAGMPPLPKEKNRRGQKRIWSRSERMVSGLLMLFLTIIIRFIFLGSSPSRHDYSPNIQQQISQIQKNSPQTMPSTKALELPEDIERLIHETSGVGNALSNSSDSSSEHSLIGDTAFYRKARNNWEYNGFGPIKRPEKDSVSPVIYEFLGKEQLTTVYRGTLPNTLSDQYSPSHQMAVMTGVSGISVDPSYISQEDDETDGVYFYSMQSTGKAAVPFPVWVCPAGKGFDDQVLYGIGGCGYWAETLLYAADQQGINGRTWYGRDYDSHLGLKWDSVQSLPDLTERLLNASANYYEYVDNKSPSMDLTIIIGPEADRHLLMLQAFPEPREEDITFVTITEEEQLDRCGSGPVPLSADGSVSHDLSLYDSSIRWIVRMRMEKDGSNGCFHPGMTKEEAMDLILNSMNGMDWVLSRFEIKES